MAIKRMTRRDFLKWALAALAAIPFSQYFSRTVDAAPQAGFNGRKKKSYKGECDLVIAKGEDPYAMTLKAVEAMGGMTRFVKKGDTVVVKPNIGWDRTPEQAGNTNPQVVAALVEMCFNAGAGKVKVFDITCNDARRCYATSGIEAAARAKGADVYFPDDWDMVKARFGYKSPLEGWPILREAVECDVFINAPVLKSHGLTRLTLSMKNLMGVCGGTRGIIHMNIGQKLVDLTSFLNPDLTVIDAYRVLVRNGPTGGDLADVENFKTVIVATDPTLADTYAADLAKVDPVSIPNIRVAKEKGFGTTDIENARKIFLEV